MPTFGFVYGLLLARTVRTWHIFGSDHRQFSCATESDPSLSLVISGAHINSHN